MSGAGYSQIDEQYQSIVHVIQTNLDRSHLVDHPACILFVSMIIIATSLPRRHARRISLKIQTPIL